MHKWGKSKLYLNVVQVQSLSSFCSTVLGTAVRIPCEVLKQRLQAGLFDNVGEAIVGTWQQDGLKGFFRGTGATLCREVPFYVAGMGLYAESKKVWSLVVDDSFYLIANLWWACIYKLLNCNHPPPPTNSKKKKKKELNCLSRNVIDPRKITKLNLHGCYRNKYADKFVKYCT